MRCAAFAPTRGSMASCAASAVLRLTIPVIGAAATWVESAAMAALEIVAMRITDRTMRWDFRMVFFSFGLLFFLELIDDAFRCFRLFPTRGPLILCISWNWLSPLAPPPFGGPVVRSNGQRAEMRKSL